MSADIATTRPRTVLLGVLCAIAVSLILMMISASTASAWTTGFVNFCYGTTLPGGTSSSCNSLAGENKVGYLTEVSGSGADRSVCVQGWSVGVKMCSGGPLQGVYNGSPPGTVVTYAEIYNNAAGANKVYGGAFFCATPGC